MECSALPANKDASESLPDLDSDESFDETEVEEPDVGAFVLSPLGRNFMCPFEECSAVLKYRRHVLCERLNLAKDLQMYSELGKALASDAHLQCGELSVDLPLEMLLLGRFDLVKKVSSLKWYRESLSAVQLLRFASFEILVGSYDALAASADDGSYRTEDKIAWGKCHAATCPFCPARGSPGNFLSNLTSTAPSADRNWEEMCHRQVELRQAVRDGNEERVAAILNQEGGTDPSHVIEFPEPCADHQANSYEPQQISLLNLSALEIAACLGRRNILQRLFGHLTVHRYGQDKIYREWKSACRLAVLRNSLQDVQALVRFHPQWSYNRQPSSLSGNSFVAQVYVTHAENCVNYSKFSWWSSFHGQNCILDQLEIALLYGRRLLLSEMLNAVHPYLWTAEGFIFYTIQMALGAFNGKFCKIVVDKIIDEQERSGLFTKNEWRSFPLSTHSTVNLVCMALMTKSPSALAAMLRFSYHLKTKFSCCYQSGLSPHGFDILLFTSSALKWQRGALMLLEAGVGANASLAAVYPSFVVRWQPTLQHRCLHVIRTNIVWLSKRNVGELPLPEGMRQWLLFEGIY